MSYTLKSGISPRPSTVDLADFWEVECLKRADHSVSIQDIARSLGIVDDVQESDREDNDEELERGQIDMVSEIERRIIAGGGKYPFVLDQHSRILSITTSLSQEQIFVYLYLLLATRTNMKDDKICDELDGTKIFERVGLHAILKYLGENAQGFNFGTSASGGFAAKLAYLVSRINDGELSIPHTSATYKPQDGNVDIVAWIPFHDGLPSKLICFGQCKTGTNWQETTEELQIDTFLKANFTLQPRLNPVKVFMIADVCPREDFPTRSIGSLFFDRCRLASFIKPDERFDGLDELLRWTQCVMGKNDLTIQN